MRPERPHREYLGRTVEWRLSHVEEIRDSEKRKQDKSCSDSFSHLLHVARVALAKLNDQHSDDVQKKHEVQLRKRKYSMKFSVTSHAIKNNNQSTYENNNQARSLEYPVIRRQIVSKPAFNIVHCTGCESCPRRLQRTVNREGKYYGSVRFIER